MPPAWRMGHRWREHWLVSTYPDCFARIPNQQTGVPPQSSRMRWQLTRSARFAWRRVLGAVRSAGLRVSVPERSYHPDDRHWSQPAARRDIERTILRNASISCEVFGRARVAETLRDFFERRATPVQVVGALYVFERYHECLPASLAGARQKTREYAC